MYNEMVLLKLVQSMTKLISNPPEIFREQILMHFRARGKAMYQRINSWMELSNAANRAANTNAGTLLSYGSCCIFFLVNPRYLSESLDKSHSKVTVSEATPSGSAQPTISSKEPELAAISTVMPDFPLIPASRGFCLTLVGLLENLLKTLETIASE